MYAGEQFMKYICLLVKPIYKLHRKRKKKKTYKKTIIVCSLFFFSVSLVTFVFIFILVVSEIQYYTNTSLKFDYEVDTELEG